MCKDVYLEGKALLQRIKEKRFFLERNIYQSSSGQMVWPGALFLEMVCLWVPWKLWQDCLTAPSPLAQGSPMTSLQHAEEVSDKAQSVYPHVYLASCGSPGHHSFTLSFVDAADLLANGLLTGVSCLIYELWPFWAEALGSVKLQNSLNMHMQSFFEQINALPDLTLKRSEVEISRGVYVCVCTCAQCKCGCLKGKPWKSAL